MILLFDNCQKNRIESRQTQTSAYEIQRTWVYFLNNSVDLWLYVYACELRQRRCQNS